MSRGKNMDKLHLTSKYFYLSQCLQCGITGIKLSLPLIIAYLMVKFKVKANMSGVLDKEG